MTRRPLALALLLGLPAVACGGSAHPVTFNETRTFGAAAGKLVSLDLSSLDADVTVASGDKISIEVALHARSSSPGGSKVWVETHTPVFTDSPGRLAVTVPAGRHQFLFIGFLDTRGHVRVTMPPVCDLEVRTSSGDVTLTGDAQLDGTVRIHTSSGDVTVSGGAKDLVVNTASGDLKVSAPRLATLEAGTASGDVDLARGASRTLIDTASGDVRLRDLTGDLSVHTSSGEVRASWEALEAGARVDVRATSGDVTLHLPRALELTGTLSTTSGDIDSAWVGSWDRRHKQLALGATGTGPAVDIDVRTTSGGITLVKSP